MPRYKGIIAYDGSNFCGFQTQPNGRTVQEEIGKTLKRINNQQEITIFGSGRTDSGVHALGQVIHFDYPQERKLESFRFALDSQTPEDIAFLDLMKVSDEFHARYHVCEKTYVFKVDVGKPRNPFKRKYASYFPYPLDYERMERAIVDLKGTHDFSAFCASGSSVENKVRTIYEAKLIVHASRNELEFIFRGNGFLYKMVRILVGTLLKIGNGKLAADSIPQIIERKDRNLAGPTAHPEGLYLKNVSYEHSFSS